MANLLWNENSPADTDSAGAGDDEIRSLKTSIRNGLAAEHAWPSATGSGFGVHLLGSARAYYGAQSNVSSAGTDGRLMVTSDSSRLFHVGSGGTMFLGGQTGVLVGDQPGQQFYWAEEIASLTITTTPQTVTFNNSGFSGVPLTTISVGTSALVGVVAHLTSQTNGNFIVRGFRVDTGSSITNYTLTYHSIGTRTF